MRSKLRFVSVRYPPDLEPKDIDVDVILQRVTGLAILLTPPTTRVDQSDPASAATLASRWAVNGAIWLVLLVVPGSLLLLPVLLFWKHRRPR